jgi:SAM-dependent methyltransferase
VYFPIVGGIPVLINESSSVFSVDDFVHSRNTTFNLKRSRIKELLVRMLPKIGKNMRAKGNYDKFTKILIGQLSKPKVLVVGGSIVGKGLESFLNLSSIEMVESDVSFGPRTRLICDAHDIPFMNDSFDGLIIQAVLEHVVDPYRCVEEIHRVLKKQGLVYAEIPFMQQVHGGRYDFTRFTHLGHRRLFRKFEEIDSGVTGGPGMALAWSCKYFLLSFARGQGL